MIFLHEGSCRDLDRRAGPRGPTGPGCRQPPTGPSSQHRQGVHPRPVVAVPSCWSSGHRRNLQLADIVNWDRMVQVLAEEEPLCRPARATYHALTYGWLAGEIIRRITGMGVEEFFVQRVVRPLKVDAWIGVPEEELPRIAQLYQHHCHQMRRHPWLIQRPPRSRRR